MTATIKRLLFLSQVEYQSKGFLEKNRDALYEDLLEIMRASKVFIGYFFISRPIRPPYFNMFLLHQFGFLANFFHEEAQSIKPTKGFKVRPARPGVKPANKELRTTVGDKVNMFTMYTRVSTLRTATDRRPYLVFALQFGMVPFSLDFVFVFVIFFFYYC